MAAMEPRDLRGAPAVMEPWALKDLKVRRGILVDLRDPKALLAMMARKVRKETTEPLAPKAHPAK